MEGEEMDWKQLVQFALQGSGGLEQYAILLVRVSIGLFFAISGANKLFVVGGTKPVYDTLVKAKVPFPQLTAYFVSGVEFVCGSLVTLGFLSSPACAALMIDMVVATLTSSLATLPKGLSPLRWLDDLLYLPEVLYVLFFIWLICSGPGKFSVDYWLAGKLLR
jgi:putative oxidoreductase